MQHSGRAKNLVRQFESCFLYALISTVAPGCLTATVWDKTLPSAYEPLKHVGISPDDSGNVIVGYARENDADEQWFVMKPERSGPDSFWIRVHDRVRSGDSRIFLSPDLESQIRNARADRLKEPPERTRWLRVVKLQTMSNAVRGMAGRAETVYTFAIDGVAANRDDAVVSQKWSQVEASAGEMLLLLPRVPSGRQTGSVILAVLATPFTVVVDTLTFPISLPAAAYRPNMGP